MMERRAFLTMVAGGLLAAPVAAGAQPGTKAPRVGFVEAGSRSANQHFLDAFRQGLRDLRYIEGPRLWTNRFNQKAASSLEVFFAPDRSDLNDVAQTALAG